MKSENKKTNIFFKIFFGFLIPYVLINSLIFFFIIEKPSINVLNAQSLESENSLLKENEIKFSVQGILPIANINCYLNDVPIEYSKDNSIYIIPFNTNGTIKIEVESINKIKATTYVDINSLDDTAPTIDVNNASFAAGTLTLVVSDNDSGVNFDSIYGTVEGEIIKPSFIDKSTGTIKFKISSGQPISIHVEDNNGNICDTTFEAG